MTALIEYHSIPHNASFFRYFPAGGFKGPGENLTARNGNETADSFICFSFLLSRPVWQRQLLP